MTIEKRQVFFPKFKPNKPLKCWLNFKNTFKFAGAVRFYIIQMNVFRKLSQISEKYRILRGMASYAVLWPCASLAEQTLCEGRTFKNYDWKKCAKWVKTIQLPFHSINLTLILCRFACFGAFAMGPALYVWIRVAAAMWPKSDIKSSLCKAITEQVGFDPFAISLFLYTMSIMDGKNTFEARKEVSV